MFKSFHMGGGLNRNPAPTDIPDDQLTQAGGCGFETAGAVTSMRGRTKLNSTALAAAVAGLGDGQRASVSHRLQKAGTTLYEDFVSIGTLAGTNRMSVISYDDYFYIATGEDGLKRWDGTTLIDAGLEVPDTSSMLVWTPAGGALAAGEYYVAVTFWNGVAESNLSEPTETHATAVANDKLQTSFVPTGPTGVIARRLYRTDADGEVLFFWAELDDNTTTEYTGDAAETLPEGADPGASSGDAITDIRREVDTLQESRLRTPYLLNSTLSALYARRDRIVGGRRAEIVATNLGALADWTDHDPPPSDLKHIIVQAEHVFGISGNEGRFSLMGGPEYWPPYNSIPPNLQSSEDMLAVEALGRYDVIFYTNSNLYRIHMVGLSFEESERIDLHSPVGLAAEWAVAEVEGQNQHLFLSHKGIYLTDGSAVTKISDELDALFLDDKDPDYINPSLISQSEMVAGRNRIYMTYGCRQAGDRLLMINLERQDKRYSVWTPPARLTSLHRETDGNAVLVGDVDGNVYQLDQGYDDDGSDITWTPRTKQYPLPEASQGFDLKAVVAEADLGGAETTFTLRVFRIDGTYKTVTWARQTAPGRQRYTQPMDPQPRGVHADLQVSRSAQKRRQLFKVGFNYEPLGDPE